MSNYSFIPHPSSLTPAVLAIDVGTSGVRAALYDERGDEVRGTEARARCGFSATRDGGAEQDAEALLGQMVRAVDEALARSERLNLSVEAVGLSCFWHSLLGVDSEGRAVTPLFGWADTRAARAAEGLRERFDEREVHARTGCRFHASYWPAKLLWLRGERPESFGRVDRWLSFSDFLSVRLFEKLKTSVSMASGTGLLNTSTCAWDEELLGKLGLAAARLPEIAAGGESFSLNGEFRRRWPRLASARWLCAVGDGAANNVGAGCTGPERAALMIGTSGAMRVMWEGPAPAELPPELWCYRLDASRVIVGGALSDGGNLYEWMKGALKFEDEESAIASTEADSHGLTVLPFWFGERSTGWHSKARGAILGLTAHTGPAEIVRAVMEAVAYRFALVALALEKFSPLREVIASGGALNASAVWAQILADVLGRPVQLSSVHEASSRGAALLALEAAGKLKSIGGVSPEVSRRFEPDGRARAHYLRALERHRKIYERLVDDEDFANRISS